MDSDDIDSLPMDTNEQFIASDFSNLQRVVKKKAVATTTNETPSPSTGNLVRDLKIVLISTVLFLIVGHPKVDQMLQKLKMDTLTLYTVKASIFALILFIMINRAC